MSERLFFVGPGRVGLALGYALQHADPEVRSIYCGRRPEPPSHPLFVQDEAEYCFGLRRPPPGTTAVFLTVPDDVLPEMAHTLAGQGPAPDGCPAFHCSGALSTEVLAPLHARGYAVGSLHPLQAVAHPVTGAERLPGSAFALSGEPEARAAGRRIVAILGGRELSIPAARRPVYHAAAVLASNHLVTLLALAGRLLVRAGVPAEEAIEALLPLARGSLANVEEVGLARALTGPVARGDVETVRLHLRTLEPEEGAVYRTLARELVGLAGEWGLDPGVVDALTCALADETARGGPGAGAGEGSVDDDAPPDGPGPGEHPVPVDASGTSRTESGEIAEG